MYKNYLLRTLTIIVSVFLALSIVSLYYYAPVVNTSSANIQQKSYTSVVSITNRDISKLGMIESGHSSTSTTLKGITLTFIKTTLKSNNGNGIGIIYSVLYNIEAIGSVIMIAHNFKNSTLYTFIPVFSSVLKGSETVNTSYNINTSSNLHALSGRTEKIVPAGQFLPVGKYSSGWLGWADSFNNYNTQGLIAWLAAGGAVSALIILLVTGGLGWPIAAIVAAALVASAAVLDLINWMGGLSRNIFCMPH